MALFSQTLTVFTFTLIAMYLIKQDKTFLFVLIPGTFYLFVISSYIFHQEIGFGPSDTASYGLTAVLSIIYVTGIFWKKRITNKRPCPKLAHPET